MVALPDLWIPILLSAVFVFVVSSILHMVVQNHNSDYKKLDNEEALLASMRDKGVRPGEYMFPCAASMKDAATPEISRAQVWHWRRHGVSLTDGRLVDADLVRRTLEEETDALREAVGDVVWIRDRCDTVVRLLLRHLLAPNLAPFVTTDAYTYL